MFKVLLASLFFTLLASEENSVKHEQHQTTTETSSDINTECTIDNEGNEICTTVNPNSNEPTTAEAAQQILNDETLNNEEIDYTFMLNSEKNYDCKNDYKSSSQCDAWAESGECSNNPGFMILNCAQSCGFCHLQEPSIRCKRHPNAIPAISKPGEINAMFERILNNFPEYSPNALSKDPWLVELHNVFTKEEANKLIELGGKNFRRSVDAGKMEGKGAQFEEIVSDARTSYTDWCTYSRGCWSNELVQNIAKRAENITLVPKENSEFFQVLRYDVGQYYVEHHDYIYGHLDLPIGPRLYTFFLYLEGPESGGGTRFPSLNITVEPEFGKVAIWPSVLDSDPLKKDRRTKHEALPVEKGVKFGANLWLHMFNFHGPYKLMCTG